MCEQEQYSGTVGWEGGGEGGRCIPTAQSSKQGYTEPDNIPGIPDRYQVHENTITSAEYNLQQRSFSRQTRRTHSRSSPLVKTKLIGCTSPRRMSPLWTLYLNQRNLPSAASIYADRLRKWVTQCLTMMCVNTQQAGSVSLLHLKFTII